MCTLHVARPGPARTSAQSIASRSTELCSTARSCETDYRMQHTHLHRATCNMRCTRCTRCAVRRSRLRTQQRMDGGRACVHVRARARVCVRTRARAEGAGGDALSQPMRTAHTPTPHTSSGLTPSSGTPPPPLHATHSVGERTSRAGSSVLQTNPAHDGPKARRTRSLSTNRTLITYPNHVGTARPREKPCGQGFDGSVSRASAARRRQLEQGAARRGRDAVGTAREDATPHVVRLCVACHDLGGAAGELRCASADGLADGLRTTELPRTRVSPRVECEQTHARAHLQTKPSFLAVSASRPLSFID
jgi:hypothetical protein